MLCIGPRYRTSVARVWSNATRSGAGSGSFTSVTRRELSNAAHGRSAVLSLAARHRDGDSFLDHWWKLCAGGAMCGAIVHPFGFWQTASSDDGSRADDGGLQVTASYLRQVWSEIERRLNAQGAVFPELGIPRIGKMEDDKLSVRLRVRQEANLSAVLSELFLGLTGGTGEGGPKSGALKMRVSQSGEGRVLLLEKFAEPSSDNPLGSKVDETEKKSLSAQLFIPTCGDDVLEIEFLKSAPMSQHDLKVVGNVLKISNRIENSPASGSFHVSRVEELMGKELEKFEDMVGFMLRDLHSFFERTDGGFPESTEWQSSPEDQEGSHSSRLPPGREGMNQEEAGVAPDTSAKSELVKSLEKMGAKVYLPSPVNKMDWGVIAGYNHQKRRIEDSLLLPLVHPNVFDGVARQTRKHFATNRPRGVLLQGPPGTGKTTSARVIASQASVPLVYIPLEAVMSKWYGEAEKLLAKVFRYADELGGSIIFLDEVETLATTRGSEMHEATRRLLGVLLREMDGFDTSKKTIVIGATNRKQDIDPALLSRFDISIKFDLPDEECRSLIIEQYAQHLEKDDVSKIASVTEGFSGRDIRDVCEQTERSWASKIVREEVTEGLPGLEEYLSAAENRHTDFE